MDRRIAVTFVAGLLGVGGAYGLFTVWEDGTFCQDAAWTCPDAWGGEPDTEPAPVSEPDGSASSDGIRWVGADPIALAIVTIGLLALATGFYIWTKRPL